MGERLRLRIHVSEPFDFERENESSDLFGWTMDDDGESDEWEVELEGIFTFYKRDYDRVLIGPRYVGEHLDKVHDALLGVPVRIAHRTHSQVDGEGWHFAMTGMIVVAPPPPPPPAPTETDMGDPADPGPDDDTTGS
jgi:hypothetical protein